MSSVHDGTRLGERFCSVAMDVRSSVSSEEFWRMERVVASVLPLLLLVMPSLLVLLDMMLLLQT